MQKMYVAELDYLIAKEDMIEETNFCSLEQRIIKGEYRLRPPLCPWEKRKGWKYPAEKRICEFMKGKRDEFVEKGSSEYINKMT